MKHGGGQTLEEVAGCSRNGNGCTKAQRGEPANVGQGREDAIVTRQSCLQGHHDELAGHREWVLPRNRSTLRGRGLVARRRGTW